MKRIDKKGLIIICLIALVSILGISYAFFYYNRLGDNQQLIMGDIYLILNDDSDSIGLTNIFPETTEKARKRADNVLTFSISGINTTTDQNIYYEIMLNEGNVIEGKTRFKPEDLKIDLTEIVDGEKTLVVDAMSFTDFKEKRIWVNTVDGNTTTELNITYELRMWLSDDTLISDSDPRADYDTETFKNSYANVKVSVNGDFKEKDVNLDINASGKLATSGTSYDVNKNYTDTLYTNENVIVTLSLEKEVSKIVITNAETKEVIEKVPTLTDGKYITEIEYSESGSYTYYGVYLDGTTSGVGTYNIKIDKDLSGSVDEVEKPTVSYCNSLTYNGSSQTLTKEAETGYTFSENTGINAGNYIIKASLSEGYTWSDGTTDDVTFTCNISKKAVTYKADDASKSYDGTSLTKQTATLTSGTLVDGHTASFEIEGTITEVGTATNTLKTVTIKSGNVDVTENYEITKQNGTLTITYKSFVVTLVSGENVTDKGTETLYVKYNDGIYLDSGYTKKMTTTENQIDVPTKTGYTFEGYYTNEGGNGTLLINSSGNITSDFTTDLYDNNISLYAKWTSNTYTVTYNGTGGNISDGITLNNKVISGGLTNPNLSMPNWALGNYGTITNEGLHIVSTSSSERQFTWYHFTAISGHIYYASIQSKIVSTGYQLSFVILNDDGWVKSTSNTTVNDNFTLQSLYWTSDGTETNIQISTHDTDVYVKNVVLIDLTEAFGSGNEPTKEWCDENIDYYSVTASNKIIDGSLTDTTIELNDWGIGGYSTRTTEGLYIEDTSSTYGHWSTQNITSTKNHIYYASMQSKVVSKNSDSDKLNFVIINSEGGWAKSTSNGSVTDNYILSSLYWTSDGTDTKVQISTGAAVIVSAYAKHVMLVDLTETFGSGNEPSKEWCDKYLSYFDGTIEIGRSSVDLNEVVFDENYVLPSNPTRLGYTFAGWYTAETGGTQVTSDTAVSTASDHTIYAHWTANTYTVTYYSNPYQYYEKDSLLVTLNGRSFKKGEDGNALIAYAFAGASTGPVLVSENSSAISFRTSYDSYATLFANHENFTMNDMTYYYERGSNWMGGNLDTTGGIITKKYSNVSPQLAAETLINDNKSDSVIKTQTFTYDISQALTANSFSRLGYSFVGWSKTPTGDVIYTDTQSVTNLATSGNVELYAIWRANTDGPSCTFTGPSISSIKNGATSLYYLDCTDNYGFNDSTLTSSDFTLSNSGIVTLSTPTKSTITNGYRYTITVTGAKGGNTTLTLKSGVLTNIIDNPNNSVTSNSITVLPTLNESIVNSLDLTTADVDGTRYVHGEVDNNYVWYSGKMWRIVALNSDGTIKLVTQGNMSAVAWDVSNTSTNYSTSQVRSWLKNVFLPTVNTNLLVDSTWDYTTYSSFPTTKITTNKSTVTDKVGLLNIYEYMMTGGTNNSSIIGNKTFLNNGYTWWTMSPNSSGSNIWSITHNTNGSNYSDYATTTDGIPSISYGIRPSVNLKSNIALTGNGTVSNPYILDGDTSVGKTGELLSTRQSGEYIKFNNIKYRIVGIENGLTKVTMADYEARYSNVLPVGYIKFGASTSEHTFSTAYGIGKYLDNWYKATSANDTSGTYTGIYIASVYKNMIATPSDGVRWYAGPDDYNYSGYTTYDYTNAKKGTAISATIGLPSYGEMLSSQFGGSWNSASQFWYITKNNSPQVWIGSSGGYATTPSLDASYVKVRPSFYLKSNVKITGGSGMPHAPYTISQ